MATERPKPRSAQVAVGVALLAGTLVALAPAPAAAAGFTVNTTTDAPDANTLDDLCATAAGQCSLRAATEQANADSTADTISVPTGDYHIGSSLMVTESVTITGADAASTVVDADDTANAFTVAFDGTESVTISRLTVQDGTGASGGAIVRTAPPGDATTLTIEDAVIRDNHSTSVGGGIQNNAGRLVVRRSTLSGNVSDGHGGGISFGDAAASLVIETSEISGNSSAGSSPGGGISIDFALSAAISDSLINGNSAPPGGGAGLYNGSTASLTNVTISGNTTSSTGGGLRNDGTMTLANATIAGNSAASANGIFNAGTGNLTVRNTVVSNGEFNCVNSGALIPGGYNLESANTCGFGATGDKVSMEPLLAPLADNGGPTETLALMSGSPAIDGGNPAAPGSGGNACAATDQRGLPRPGGAGGCDIGAYELTLCRGAPVNRFSLAAGTIAGTAGADGILGSSGSDTIDAGGGDDRVCAGDGNDQVSAGEGNDFVEGGNGDDQITTGEGKDLIEAGAGDDQITGGEGNDGMDGGTGADRLIETGNVDFILTNATLTSVGGADSHSGIERATLTGGPGDNLLDAQAFTGAATLSGEAGNDVLGGGTGNDSLDGGPGDDVISGDPGNDVLDGGAGSDVLIAAAAPNLTLTDTRLTGLGTDSVASVESAVLAGGPGKNTIDASRFSGAVIAAGGGGADRLRGGSRTDFLLGGRGRDRLSGGRGNDRLTGGRGADRLLGGRGKDRLDGGGGIDTCVGGKGVDTFKRCEIVSP